MLHNEDEDINKVIRDIIELDSKAIRIKNNIVARGDEILDEAKEKIKRAEKLEIENTQLIAKKNYKTQIEQAEKERDIIIADMKEEIQKTYSRYSEKKNEKAEEVIKMLFKASLNQ